MKTPLAGLGAHVCLVGLACQGRGPGNWEWTPGVLVAVPQPCQVGKSFSLGGAGPVGGPWVSKAGALP